LYESALPAGEDLVVFPVAENKILITFAQVPYVTGLLDSKDSLNPDKYAVTSWSGEGLDGSAATQPSIVLVEVVEGSPTALYLYTDRPLTHYPATFELTATNIYGSASSIIYPSISSTFLGLKKLFEKPVVGTYRQKGTKDLANPQQKAALLDPQPDVTDLNLGSFSFDDSGDYGFDEGVENLRKRIIRRCLVRPGGFVWLPEYGVGIEREGKRLNNRSRRDAIRSAVESQILQEPDIQQASVSLLELQGTPELLWLVVKVRTTTDNAYQLDIPVERF
jgi:hypothetical protein